MALKSTVYKADLQIADMDRGYYADHSLTLARHPSETDERLMVRLLAFALHAHERLQFGQGMTDSDEPDLWRRDLTGRIEQWIDVGLPEDKLLKKACSRADEVVLLCYGRTAELWWNQNRAALERLPRLRVQQLDVEASQALAALAERSMRLQCTVQDGQVWFGHAEETVSLQLQELKSGGAA